MITIDRCRAIARVVLLDLVGLVCIAAAGALMFLDAKADGQLALSTSMWCGLLGALGGWLIDRQLFERFLTWLIEWGRKMATGVKAAKSDAGV